MMFSVRQTQELTQALCVTFIDLVEAFKLIKDEQIKDSDILFFSQYGHLEGTGDDSNFQILQGIDTPNDNFQVNSEEISQELRNNNALDFSSSSQTVAPLKKESFLHFAQAKYKELDGKSTRVFECGICGKEFGHQYTLMRHLPTHTDERKFHCLTCGKSFRQMSTLSQHRAIHSSERPYICEVCNKNFNRVSTLISHRKTHTGIKPHRCHMCNKAFHQKGNLRNHIFTHTNERPYKCDICDKGFNQMSNLMCHKMKAHQHQSDIIPKYSCKICGEEFLKRINLRQHEQFKHGVAASGDVRALKDYSNAILVDPIKTDAMKLAILSGNTPFALLRPLSGIPVLVRVIPAGEKQMLVPATAEDLKKYGHISVRPKVADAKTAEGDARKSLVPIISVPYQPQKGCVVQIKVPVVATVIQKSIGLNGHMSMNILSPGPGDILDERGGTMSDLNVDSFVYTSTLTEEMLEGSGGVGNSHKATGTGHSIDSLDFDDKYENMISNVTDAEVEFVNQSGNATDGTNFQKNLDVNSMEFTFDVPQDATGPVNYASTENSSDNIIMFSANTVNNIQEVSGPPITDNTSTFPSANIPDKIVLEENGQFVEL